MITSFTGEYRFLSNFYPVTIIHEDINYPSVEHAYVASKTKDRDIKLHISHLTSAGYVKKFGRSIDIIENWNTIKLPIMRNLVEQKFSHLELYEKLLQTRPHELIEGNTWGDVFWGQCPLGKGRNELGKILMSIRDNTMEFE